MIWQQRRVSERFAYSDGYDIRPEPDGREHVLLGAADVRESPEPVAFRLVEWPGPLSRWHFVHRGHHVEIAAYPYSFEGGVITWSSKDEHDRWCDDGGAA